MAERPFTFFSCFSGIEAASVAWKDLGWHCAGLSEIDPFANAVLAHHYPQTKNYGSITEFKSWGIEPGSIDLLIGGSPCQAFSRAGLQQGLADPRGQLSLCFLAAVNHWKPRWVIWENVPGVLGSNNGRDFATFLFALQQCGYGFAYRILDAKGTGRPEPIPQRRRRVFLVAAADGWQKPAKILFEPESLSWNPDQGAPERVTAAKTFGTGFDEASRAGRIHFRKSRRAQSATDFETWTESGHTNTLNLFDLGDTRTTSAIVESEAVLYENHAQDSRVKECKTVSPTICAKFGTGGGNTPLVREVITFQPGNLVRRAGANPSNSFVTTLKASSGDQTPHIAEIHCVRRLHPIEAERLQGFPDNHTQIPWKGKPADKCPEAPRFKCVGNSMAVPVIRLLGERIAKIEGQQKTQ